MRTHLSRFPLLLLSLLALILACTRTVSIDSTPPPWDSSSQSVSLPLPSATHPAALLVARPPGAPIYTPTPDIPHSLPPLRRDADQYVVQSGDTLGQIAQAFEVSVELLMQANNLTNPDVLDVGQPLVIPAPTPQGLSPDFKLIPDSELVYGPMTSFFDTAAFIQSQAGYLAGYREKLDEDALSGAQIVDLIARDYSVNPRLLLAALEYQGGWLTQAEPKSAARDYPLGWRDPQRKGLYRQLAWAANNLNRGYYLFRVNGIAAWTLPDGRVAPIAPTINAATAGVQHLFSQLYSGKAWKEALSPQGFMATYTALFGYPFDFAIEPLLPPDLKQPSLQLPFEEGVRWAFTGGPHAGWDSGSAWAGLDFAPGSEALGCVQSDDWVVAVADGMVLRAANGLVIQDLNGEGGVRNDGLEGTGWVVVYMHIENRGRVDAGTYLQAGERIGHPSCEGGPATGTHVHLARRYNGEWIPADQKLPFVLEGWVSVGLGVEYEGTLERNGKKVEAEAGNSPNNIIKR